MKHPTLSVKKNSYVYDDTASKQGPQAYPASTRIPVREHRTTRPRKSRRGLTFLPLLVLALGLVVVFRFIPRSPADRTTLAGWQVVLRATVVDGSLIVGVTFIAGQKTLVSPQATSEASVQVTLPDTGNRLTLSGLLEKSPMTLRGEVPYTPRMKHVEATVSLLDMHATLRALVP